MYTLKLDWDDDRIRIVCDALETYISTSMSPSVLDAVTSEERDVLIAGAAEAVAALGDIKLYRDTVEEIKAELTTDTTGYCTGCGEYIELMQGTGMWLSYAQAQKTADGYHCQQSRDRLHVKHEREP